MSLALTPILDDPELAGVLSGDLMAWTEQEQDSLLTTAQEYFETIIPPEELAAISLDDINPAKLPRGRQVEIIRAARWCIAHKQPLNMICEAGSGKTKMSINGTQLDILKAWRRGKKFRVWIICPGHLVLKWIREYTEELEAARAWAIGQGWFAKTTAPHLQCLIAHRMEDLNVRQERVPGKLHPLDADVILSTYEDISLSYERVASYVRKPILEEDGTPSYKVCKCPLDCLDEQGHMVVDPDAPCCPGHYRYPNQQGTPHFCDKHHGNIVYGIACPSCGEQQYELVDGKKIYLLDGDYGKAWIDCVECGTPLWQANARNLPLTPRFINDKTLLGKALNDFELWGNRLVGKGSRKLGLFKYYQKYLAKVMPIAVVIADETHMGKSGESARGMAMGGFLSVAQRSRFSLTATPTGGYSSSVFFLGQRTWPTLNNDFGYREVGRFVDVHGTYARTFERGEQPKPDEEEVGAISGRKAEGTYGRATKKEVPGLSPAAYRYFLSHAGFALKVEVFPELPPYKEHIWTIELDNETKYPITIQEDGGEADVKEMTQADAVAFVEHTLRGIMMAYLQAGSRRFMGVYSQNVLRYPNICTVPLEVKDPETEQTLLKMSAFPERVLFPKEQRVLDEVVAAAKASLQTMIYVNHVHAPDVAGRIYEVLTRHGADKLGRPLKVLVLRADKPKPENREAYLKDFMEKQHYDVLITSPKLVEVGLDLVWARKIIWYQQITSVYTMSQASQRSLRPGVAGNIDVSYPLYQNTAEMVLAELMAKKMRVHSLMNGSGQYAAFTRDLSGDMDLTTLLAERLGSQARSLFVDPKVLARSLAPQVVLARRADIIEVTDEELDDVFA